MWDICFHLHSEFLWGRGEAVGQVGKLASEARYIPHLALLAKIPSIPIGILGILTKDEGPETIRFWTTPRASGCQLGENNPLARGEQSDPRTAENAPKTNHMINL